MTRIHRTRATGAPPDPCAAPVVMILAGSEDTWFAVTGFEHEVAVDDGVASR
ncbi:hypothetical protein FHW12_003366 [Dokdonella fugitiva]|uniref:Uncharacterized protein n=1 Tax=Dokdonella fugitiva TaxID=328517 RepID=A0A839F286_9GAMM|nr:hypothetical protein [Dokdonella fugitiva]MBA8889123.1 hypothetical protein [Dokdonella fugitiva]